MKTRSYGSVIRGQQTRVINILKVDPSKLKATVRTVGVLTSLVETAQLADRSLEEGVPALALSKLRSIATAIPSNERTYAVMGLEELGLQVA